MDDLDVMRRAIRDARKLVAEPNSLSEALSTEWEDGSPSFDGKSSRERAFLHVSCALYTQRMNLITIGQKGDWLSTDKSKLENSLENTLKDMAEERAWGLLEKELGSEAFGTFQKTGTVTLEAKNARSYMISRNGDIQVFWKNESFLRTSIKSFAGKLENDGYAFPDAMATLVKWLKSNPEVVDKTIQEHCGKIHIKGGEIDD